MTVKRFETFQTQAAFSLAEVAMPLSYTRQTLTKHFNKEVSGNQADLANWLQGSDARFGGAR